MLALSKISYRSNRHKVTHRSKREEQGKYWCKPCNAYHLTSQSEEK